MTCATYVYDTKASNELIFLFSETKIHLNNLFIVEDQSFNKIICSPIANKFGQKYLYGAKLYQGMD